MAVLLGIGFAAGIVTALSPCVLPVLPILLAGGAGGGRRRPYAIIAGVVVGFTVFTLTAAPSWTRSAFPATSSVTSPSACCSWPRPRSSSRGSACSSSGRSWP